MHKEIELIHVYFVPGMAANPSIFEYIELSKDRFQIHLLEWMLPKVNESLQDYALRWSKDVKHDHAVLVGVSFGGIVAQEMSEFLNLKRLIIISSVKCRSELPRRMRYASKTGLFKLLPTSILHYVDHFEKIAYGDFLMKRAKLYRKYLSVRDTAYLDWAIKNMVCWEREIPEVGVIHIHGDKDEVFPFKYIKGCITVRGGTHIMVVNRFRWFNKYLPELILNGVIKKKERKKTEKL